MTLAMIVTVASIRETVRVWVETTLRSDLWIKADAGGRTGIVGDLPPRRAPLPAVDRGCRRGRPVPRRARRRTSAGVRSPWRRATSGWWPAPAGSRFSTGATRTRRALEARARGEVLVSEPFARRFAAGKRRPGAPPDARGAARVACRGRLSRLLERPRHGRHGPGAVPRPLRRPADHEPRRDGPARRGPRGPAPPDPRRRRRALRSFRLDEPGAAPRGLRDLRPDLRGDPRARSDRGRGGRPRHRQRLDGLGRRAAALLRSAPRDRRVGRSDPPCDARRGAPVRR